ncbi:SAM50-like protein SpAC17C9.06 [Termitomyces sp. T112]|nr:SAM50-like protein SpAC17C9.06 [Termitomyces sp. T112]
MQLASTPHENRDKDFDEFDAKILKWREQRTAEKLRGEYESAVLHLSEVIQENLSAPFRISSVKVEGATTTRRSFLGSLINPVLSSSSDLPSNLDSVLHTSRKISHLLQKTDVFHSIETLIEHPRDASLSTSDVDIVFKVREKGRFFLSTSTELGNNEGNAAATGRIRNVFGGAEVFEANVSFGTKTRRSFRAAFTAPLTSSLGTYGEVTAFGLERDNSSFASCTEGLRGVKATIRNGILPCGVNEIAYEAVLRHIGSLTPSASIGIREAAGQTLKSALSHSFIIDSRNDRLMPTKGHYIKVFNEFAGLGGDASFYKSELEGQISRPVIDGISLALAARTGILYGINKPTLFSDRFQLGGPLSVRAFRANSMGPKDGSDSLGGDLHWSVGASIISNLPVKPHWPLKTHVWLNAGRLDAIDQSRPLLDSFRSTFTNPSVSVGVGMIYRFEPVRVEVNFGVPLITSKSDGSRRGLQVGMGLEFL